MHDVQWISSRFFSSSHEWFDDGASLLVQSPTPLTGYIVNKLGNTVKIDLGSQIGIKNDMIFNVYEEGDVIKHPKTGEVLDVEKVHIGKIIVTNVSQKISDAEIVEGDPSNTIKYGHKVQYTREVHVESKGKLNVKTIPNDAIIRILNIIPPYRT